MNDTLDQKTYQRIEKIMQRVERGATENERNIALQMAVSILAKHQMSIEDFNLDTQERNKPDLTHFELGKKNVAQWKIIIVEYVSKANFCYYYLSGNGCMIVGTHTNRNTAMLLCRYLFNIVDEETRRAVREYQGWDSPKTYGNNYRLGMAQAIADRLIQEMQVVNASYAKEQEAKQTDIVVSDIYEEHRKKMKDFVTKTKGIALSTKFSQPTRYSQTGRSAGAAAGSRVSLRPINALPHKK